jgi:nucleotide-binding universal stress UspA family protein
LPAARTLANALDAQIRLLRVVGEPGLVPEDHTDEIREATAYLDALARDLAGTNLHVRTSIRPGEPHQAILREIAEQRINLVVMATRGRSGLVRAVLGSVASNVVSRSPIPLVLLRADSRTPTELARLLVPVDGSPGGALALAAAKRLADATCARVTILQVVEPIPSWTLATDPFMLGNVDPDWEDAALAGAHAYVDQLVERLRARDVSAVGIATVGQISAVIAQTALDIAADLIVMSTRARTGPARAVLGSVADAVVRQAQPPVLLVPHASAMAASSLALDPELVGPSEPAG